jgi:DNA-binding NarL/FixJ family response regulator
VRESLSGLIGIGDHIAVVGSTGQAASVLELVADCRPDVVIVDPRLPEVERGRTLIASLRKHHPDVAILVLCWSEAAEPTLRDCAADGFLRKTFRLTELTAAIVAANHAGAAQPWTRPTA